MKKFTKDFNKICCVDGVVTDLLTNIHCSKTIMNPKRNNWIRITLKTTYVTEKQINFICVAK